MKRFIFVTVWISVAFGIFILLLSKSASEVNADAMETASHRLFRRKGAAAAGASRGGGGSRGGTAAVLGGAAAGAVVGGAVVAGGVAAAPAPAPSPEPAPTPKPPPPKPYTTANGWIPPMGETNTGGVHQPDEQLPAPLPTMTKDDPKDDQINTPLNYQGAFIYEDNPCKDYNENSNSRPNKKRKKGCRKAARRFANKAAEVPSTKCPDPGEGRCFHFENMSGRCYLLVNATNPTAIHYELINKC